MNFVTKTDDLALENFATLFSAVGLSVFKNYGYAELKETLASQGFMLKN